MFGGGVNVTNNNECNSIKNLQQVATYGTKLTIISSKLEMVKLMFITLTPAIIESFSVEEVVELGRVLPFARVGALLHSGQPMWRLVAHGRADGGVDGQGQEGAVRHPVGDAANVLCPEINELELLWIGLWQRWNETLFGLLGLPNLGSHSISQRLNV